MMHRYGVPEPYEKLKAFTRGQKVTQGSMQVSGGVLLGSVRSAGGQDPRLLVVEE